MCKRKVSANSGNGKTHCAAISLINCTLLVVVVRLNSL